MILPAVEKIADVIRPLAGMVKVIERPVGNNEEWPAAVIYLSNADWVPVTSRGGGGNPVLEGPVTIRVDVHYPGENIPEAVAHLEDFPRSIPEAIFRAYGNMADRSFRTVIPRVERVRCTLATSTWGDVKTTLYRFDVICHLQMEAYTDDDR